MANILKGVQYRTLKAKLPSWRSEENYNEWEDCGNITEFPTGTEFRVAPKFAFVVTDSFDKKVLTSKDKTEAMAKVSSMLAEGSFAAIRREDFAVPHIATYLSDQSIQFKLSGSDKWVNPPHFGGTALGSPIRFRVRPDVYWEVSVKTGIAQGNLTFDDVDDVDKYVSRQLRTSDNNIVINRRAYGTVTYV